jgi:hypothetical protein
MKRTQPKHIVAIYIGIAENPMQQKITSKNLRNSFFRAFSSITNFSNSSILLDINSWSVMNITNE